jgi:hypothetical protein
MSLPIGAVVDVAIGTDPLTGVREVVRLMVTAHRDGPAGPIVVLRAIPGGNVARVEAWGSVVYLACEVASMLSTGTLRRIDQPASAAPAAWRAGRGEQHADH